MLVIDVENNRGIDHSLASLIICLLKKTKED